MTRRPAALLLMLVALGGLDRGPARGATPDRSAAGDTPDPASVQRYGPAYRYPRAGWIVLHIEGTPYERGYQHGRLLAPELADYVKTLATKRSQRDPVAAWNAARTQVNALFLRKFDPEYLEEMKGIADGAAAAGAAFEGRAFDLLDAVTVNCEVELDFVEDALAATADGLESRRFREPPDTAPAPPPVDHCSAFAATGPATADGHAVIGHITMFSLHFVRHFNVWLDVKPEKGHRVMMQTFPGGIWSGMDYYMNDAGLVVAETTIRQTRLNTDGTPLACRARKALQYSDSIDEAVAALRDGNNGLYSNEWLLADMKTDEIAMFELGTHKNKLWRSGRDEWFGGTKGFYWGCNNAKDLDVRLETVAGVEGRPANLVFRPSDRDRAWLAMYEKHKGKIGVDFGFEAFTTPPLSAFPSLDAKFTTAALAKEMKTWAVFGPPRGKTWDPSPAERARFAEARPLVPNDWTVLSAEAPPAAPGRPARPGVAAAEALSIENLTAEKSRAIAKVREVQRLVRSTADPALVRARAKVEEIKGLTEVVQAAGAEPARSTAAVDLVPNHDGGRAGGPEPTHPTAWHGTILPQSESDTWLAAAFADYERVVAAERATRDRAAAQHRKVSAGEEESLALTRFAPYSTYRAAVARLGHDVPLAQTRAELTDDAWYDIAAGKGQLLLAALRSKLGDEAFLNLMDAFGRAHAGKPASTAEFRAAAVAAAKSDDVGAFFDAWLTQTGLPVGPSSSFWATGSYERELDRAVIVYGTRREAAAQREAAYRLQRQVERKWSNIALPVLSDKEATPEAIQGRHVLLVGRPETNAAAGRLVSGLAATFGPASFRVGGELYAHPHSALIIAGARPDDPRSEVVLFTGLSAEATWHCVEGVGTRGTMDLSGGGLAEAVVIPAHGRSRRLAFLRPAAASAGVAEAGH